MLAQYMLRLAEALQDGVGDYFGGVALLELARANSEGGVLAAYPNARAQTGPLSPASVRNIADRLGAPHETTRRRLLALHEAGLMRRIPGGFVVTSSSIEADPIHGVATHLSKLHRFVAALGRYGVLDLWDSERRGAVEG